MAINGKRGKGRVEIFLEKVKKIHKDKYDYSEVEYLGTEIKIKIICPEHGVFWQTPHQHIKGKECKKCGFIKAGLSGRLTHSDFLKRCNNIHNYKYDYSKTIYTKSLNKITIICPEHGEYEQVANDHLSGHGCFKCQYDMLKETRRMEQEEWIRKANIVHGDKYDYSKSKYENSKAKILIICKKHGEFCQGAAMHLQGQGCPICNESKGELKIREYCKNKNINFKQQYTISGCLDKGLLKFDFYLTDQQLLIEFDGIQHFRPNSFCSNKSEENMLKNFDEIKKRDQIKTQFCKDNNIKLLRIPYWKINNIENILDGELNNGRQ